MGEVLRTLGISINYPRGSEYLTSGLMTLFIRGATMSRRHVGKIVFWILAVGIPGTPVILIIDAMMKNRDGAARAQDT